jgi:hypothetical protein
LGQSIIDADPHLWLRQGGAHRLVADRVDRPEEGKPPLTKARARVRSQERETTMKQQERSFRPESNPAKTGDNENAKKKLERAQQQAAGERKKGGYQ